MKNLRSIPCVLIVRRCAQVIRLKQTYFAANWAHYETPHGLARAPGLNPGSLGSACLRAADSPSNASKMTVYKPVVHQSHLVLDSRARVQEPRGWIKRKSQQ